MSVWTLPHRAYLHTNADVTLLPQKPYSPRRSRWSEIFCVLSASCHVVEESPEAQEGSSRILWIFQCKPWNFLKKYPANYVETQNKNRRNTEKSS
jgi:hypothetical protein